MTEKFVEVDYESEGKELKEAALKFDRTMAAVDARRVTKWDREIMTELIGDSLSKVNEAIKILDEYFHDDDHGLTVEEDPAEDLVSVFVYGTLKVGEANDLSNWRGGEIQYRGPASVDGFSLYDFGHFPGIYLGGGVVYGHQFLVGPEILERLDLLEGVPHLYTREKVTIRDFEGVPKPSWIYVKTGDPRGEFVESGDWSGKEWK